MTCIFVCSECPDGARRLSMIAGAIAGEECGIRASACLSGCHSGGSVAVRSPGRMAWLFGPVEDGDLDDLRRFLGLYRANPKGVIHDARPLTRLRFKVLARIPAA